MQRLERILDLVHVLQSAREPISLSALRTKFPDYDKGSEDATRRKFERDKAALADIGIVLRYVENQEEGSGYSIDYEASYLPEFELGEADQKLLSIASKHAIKDTAFPFRNALRLALAKLDTDPTDNSEQRFFVHGFASSEGDQPSHISILTSALTTRKRVHIAYTKPNGDSSKRDIDPYGIFVRNGLWYLTGLDHKSEETRVFRISRIAQVTLNTKQPAKPDFEVPEDFQLSELTSRSPLHFGTHESLECVIRVDPEITFLADPHWGSSKDGTFRFETTHLEFVVEQVLSFGRRAELLSPPRGRQLIRAALESVLSAHEVSA